jgi:tetratricopeptide (TPR) repeat protein
MPRLRRSLLFAIISLLATTVSLAQKGGPSTGNLSEIQGSITNDEDNRPILNAKVQLTTVAGQIVNSSYTGQDGRFSFRNLARGDYMVTVTADGFESGSQKVMILGMNVPEVRIALRKPANLGEKTSVGGDTVSSRELMLPKNAQQAFHKGMEKLYKKNDPSGSMPYFQKVLTAAPNFYEAYYQEGMAYTFESKLADAETAFQKAIAASQDMYPDACFGLAAILSDQERFKQSEPLSRHGLELQPEAWRGHFELARALSGLGRTAEAEQSALEARKRNPGFSGLYIVLANIHLQLRNDVAVLDDLTTYLKMDPNGPFASQAKDLKAKTERALSRKGPPTSQHPN